MIVVASVLMLLVSSTEPSANRDSVASGDDSAPIVLAQRDDDEKKGGRSNKRFGGPDTLKHMSRRPPRPRGDDSETQPSRPPPRPGRSVIDSGEPEQSQAESPPPAPVASIPANKIAEVDPDIDFELRKRKGKFSFEFSKAEIIDIVKAISDITRQNFVIPEKIKSQRITILSPTKISAQEAYQVFYTALASNGITIVKTGKFYKLVDSKDSSRDTIPTCIGGAQRDCITEEEQMVAILLPMRYTDASQVLTVVKSLLSKDGDATVFAPTNSLIISEYSPNLTRIRKIIESLDVPGFDDELQIVTIQYATATEIAEKLTQIFEITASRSGSGQGPGGRPRRPTDAPSGEGGGPAGGGDDSEVQISKIIPDDRTNQIIIKAHRRSFEAIKNIIAKLDVPISEADQGRVHVYYLENASAEDLSSTLSSLAQSGGQHAGAAGATGGGRTANREAAAGGAAPRAAGESAVLFEGEVKITADKATNSLIVVASGHDFRSLRNIIEQLDKPRRQVYVEAAILEVTVTDDQNSGVNWHTPLRFSKDDLGSTLGGAGTFGFVQSAQGTGGLSPTLTALSSPAQLLQVAGGSVAGIVGKGINVPVGSTTVSFPSFGVILKWLQSSSSANILSTPHILTTDNEEASIEVGSKIPFQTGTSLAGAGLGTALGGALGGAGTSGNAGSLGGLGGLGSSLFSSTQRIDVSLKLTITPQINERQKIRLEIEQKIEDVTGQDERTQQPITANRAAKTVVVVDDQQTIVLGGLMRDRTTKSESKLPLLGDIPILGWLFKQHSTKKEKVNLLLVLTPYIISDRSDFQRVFERKLKEHEEFAADFYGEKAEYRAHVDYARKNGPLALLGSAILMEKSRLENGGEGAADETIIRPNEPKKAPEAAPQPSPTDEEAPPPQVMPPEVTPEAAPAPEPTPTPEVAPEPTENEPSKDAAPPEETPETPAPESEEIPQEEP